MKVKHYLTIIAGILVLITLLIPASTNWAKTQTIDADLSRPEVIKLIAVATEMGLNFRGVNLSGINLEGLDLSNANLSSSTLIGANLQNVLFINASRVANRVCRINKAEASFQEG